VSIFCGSSLTVLRQMADMLELQNLIERIIILW
jgi:hypothetical protein